MIRNDPQLHTIWRILKDFLHFKDWMICGCSLYDRVYGGVLVRSSEDSAMFKGPKSMYSRLL